MHAFMKALSFLLTSIETCVMTHIVENGTNTPRGIAFMLLAVAGFSTMDMLIKAMDARYPVVELVFFRSLFGLIPITLAILMTEGFRVFKTDQPLFHVMRGTFGFLTTILFFSALPLMKLGDLYAIAMAGPLLITALSMPLLGEKVGLHRWAAVLVGFSGVVMVVLMGEAIPGENPIFSFLQRVSVNPAVILSLAAVVFFALMSILARIGGRKDSGLTMAVYYTLTVLSLTSLFLIIRAIFPDFLGSQTLAAITAFKPIAFDDWTHILAIGISGGIANICITNAFKWAPPAIIAPLDYLALVIAMIGGYVFWREIPNAWSFSGAAIIVICGLYIVWRENRHLPIALGQTANMD